jgi:hypothetical protein
MGYVERELGYAEVVRFEICCHGTFRLRPLPNEGARNVSTVTRGIVDDIASRFRRQHSRLDTSPRAFCPSRLRNGLPHASQPREARSLQPRRCAAHAVDHHGLHHEPPACPAAATSFPALRRPQGCAGGRLPCHAAHPDPASSAPEDHRNSQRPHTSAGPKLHPWQLPLEL